MYPSVKRTPSGTFTSPSDGEVSPCVYLYPPLPSPFKRIFCGKEYWIEKVSFGNIFRDPFSAIWNGTHYEEFRNRFIEREKEFRELYLSLWDSPKIRLSKQHPPTPSRTM